MKFGARAGAAALLLLVAGCTPPAKETFRLAPADPPGPGVEIASVRGYGIAVSHKDHSDVSAFGVVHESVMVVWIRYENYFDHAVEVEPGRIELAVISAKGKSKGMAVFSQEQKSSGEAKRGAEMLETNLSGVYRMLTGSAPDTKLAPVKNLWQENTGEYESLRQVLLKKTPLATNERLEGYVISVYVPGVRYVLSVPLRGETHRFEFVPLRKS